MLARPVEYTGGATSLERELEALYAETKQLWRVIDPDGATRKQCVAAGITSLQLNADDNKTATSAG